MGAIVGTIIGYIVKTFAGGSSTGPGSVSVDVFVGFVSKVTQFMQVVGVAFDLADESFSTAVKTAKDVGDQVEGIGNDLKFVTEHTYLVVIPNSLRWLRGDLIVHYINPIWTEIHKLIRSINFLLGWHNEIDHWRKVWVDPWIHNYINFRTWFFTWPRAVLGTVYDWLHRPGAFATFAVPLLARPLADYLKTSAGKAALFELTGEILDETPQRYFKAEAAAVGVLQSEGW